MRKIDPFGRKSFSFEKVFFLFEATIAIERRRGLMIVPIPRLVSGPNPAQIALAQGYLSFLPAQTRNGPLSGDKLQNLAKEMDLTLSGKDGQLVSVKHCNPAWLFRMSSDPSTMLRLIPQLDYQLPADFILSGQLISSQPCPPLIVAHAPGADKSTVTSRLFLSPRALLRTSFPSWEYFELLEDRVALASNLALLWGGLQLLDPLSREVFFTKIKDLPFNARVAGVLERNNVIYVGELVQKTEKDLLGMQESGRKTLDEVRRVLAERGWKLGTDLKGIWP